MPTFASGRALWRLCSRANHRCFGGEIYSAKTAKALAKTPEVVNLPRLDEGPLTVAEQRHEVTRDWASGHQI